MYFSTRSLNTIAALPLGASGETTWLNLMTIGCCASAVPANPKPGERGDDRRNELGAHGRFPRDAPVPSVPRRAGIGLLVWQPFAALQVQTPAPGRLPAGASCRNRERVRDGATQAQPASDRYGGFAEARFGGRIEPFLPVVRPKGGSFPRSRRCRASSSSSSLPQPH